MDYLKTLALNSLPELNVYCGSLLKSLLYTSHKAGREMERNIGPVNEYEAQIVIVPFVSIIIRKE
jgi:hypothetical protein